MSAPEKNAEAGRILAEMLNLGETVQRRLEDVMAAHVDGRATSDELTDAMDEVARIRARIQEWAL